MFVHEEPDQFVARVRSAIKKRDQYLSLKSELKDLKKAKSTSKDVMLLQSTLQIQEDDFDTQQIEMDLDQLKRIVQKCGLSKHQSFNQKASITRYLAQVQDEFVDVIKTMDLTLPNDFDSYFHDGAFIDHQVMQQNFKEQHKEAAATNKRFATISAAQFRSRRKLLRSKLLAADTPILQALSACMEFLLLMLSNTLLEFPQPIHALMEAEQYHNAVQEQIANFFFDLKTALLTTCTNIVSYSLSSRNMKKNRNKSDKQYQAMIIGRYSRMVLLVNNILQSHLKVAIPEKMVMCKRERERVCV